MTESDPDPHQSTAAIILATGQSERMRSRRATVLHALAGRPMAYYPANAALIAGCSPVVVVCNAETEQLREDLRDAAIVVPQAEGNALEAVLTAIPAAATTLLVVSGTMPLLAASTMRRLSQHWHETSSQLVLLATTQPPAAHGVIGIAHDAAGRVRSVCRDVDASDLDSTVETVTTGVACVSREWLWQQRGVLALQDEDCIATLAELALAVGARVDTVTITGEASETLQITQRADLALAELSLRERIRARAMRHGVTLIDPATAWIDSTVSFGRDVTIFPNCHLYGNTLVGDNCTIGPNTRIQDSRLAPNVTVVESIVEGAEVDENVRIGPFAHLRPGTVIANDVEIGNYAELKNTRVGPGAKIHHVGYLGDTVVGSDVNVGAGTITCNYDGADKHETEIGDGAFIGSGTLLVAPVRVGSKAMTGAGSVVTRDVPAQAKAYGVPARVRGVRALPADADQDGTGEKKGA